MGKVKKLVGIAAGFAFVLGAGQAAFCEGEAPTTVAVAPPVAAAPASLAQNQYLQDSLHANERARSAYAAGDYDAALRYSQEATRLADLSDEYIQTRKADAVDKKLKEAEKRLAWADASGARKYYKTNYRDARSLYKAAKLARSSNDFDGAMKKAVKVVTLLSKMTAPPPLANKAAAKEKDQQGALPAQYIVRPWDTYGDCFWNIAGCTWAYGNPWKWPVLYRANRMKLPNPRDPNIIRIGTVLDIPSLHGEFRAGMWDSGRKYSPLD
jgi:hypothetical protein